MGLLDVLGHGLQALLDLQRRTEGALGVVLVGDWRAEERHHAVAEKLVDRTFVAVNGVQDHLEDAVHDPVHVFGIELLGHRREARHIREHDCDDLPLALDCAL